MPTIKLTNDVILHSSSLSIGVDVNNLIASSPSKPYTATQDCWVYCIYAGNNNSVNWSVDDVTVYAANNHIAPFIVKKGSVLKSTRDIYKVFGLK